MIRRLRWKMTLISTGLAALLLLSVCLGWLFSLRSSLRRDSLTVLARVIDETETPAWDQTEAVLSLPYFTVTVTPGGGTSITSSQFYDLTDYARLTAAVDAALSQGRAQGELPPARLRYLRQATSEGWRMAFVDTTFERSTLRRAVRTVALTGLAGVGVLFGLSVLLARWAVGPVEQSMARQQQFIADASHELKTPLTVMLSNAELVARAEGLPPDAARWNGNIRAAGGQMQSLIEQMLTLARNDRQESLNTETEVDLSDLAETALLLFEPVVYEAGRVLHPAQLQPGLMVRGEAEALNRVLEVLLDNAVKYTPPGGGIALTLEQEGKSALLRLRSDGEPIPAGELERIFDRFYRSDAARASEGFGLGLSIARGIAEAHGGRLWAESGGEGNTFCLKLPLLSE